MRLSGEKGCAAAQHMIANYYKSGIFAIQDDRKYLDWVLEAANNKYSLAILEMIDISEQGCEILKMKPNQKKAQHWRMELEKLK